MAAQQTSYSLEVPAPSQPGMITGSGAVRVRPFRNDNASAIPFGRAVCRSANADLRGFDTLVTTRQFLGVVSWGQSQEMAIGGGAGNDGAPATEMQGILEEGECLVEVIETVTPESPVRVILEGANIGKFATTKVTAVDTTVLLTNAKFINGRTGAGVVKVRIDFPAPVLLVADT